MVGAAPQVSGEADERDQRHDHKRGADRLPQREAHGEREHGYDQEASPDAEEAGEDPPVVMGIVKDATGDYVMGFVFLVAFAWLCAGQALAVREPHRRPASA